MEETRDRARFDIESLGSSAPTAGGKEGAVRSARVSPFAKREKGAVMGTYATPCDICRGAGIHFENYPRMVCHKCEGSGKLVVMGERHGDLQKLMSARLGKWFLILGGAAIVAAIYCALLIWKSGAL